VGEIAWDKKWGISGGEGALMMGFAASDLGGKR